MQERLLIHEIYKSIQGESSWAGWGCVFVRLTGCPLRCRYCDTPQAFDGGTWMTVDEIVSAVVGMGGKLVEITGGEPLMQLACGALAAALLAREYTVLCETSGSLPIDRLPDGVIRIMDIKCPSSGESHRNDWANIDRLQARDEVKFVIGDREDFDWAAEVIGRYGLDRRCTVLLSPVHDRCEPRQLVEWMLEKQLPVRFQLPLHKIIWEPEATGV